MCPPAVISAGDRITSINLRIDNEDFAIFSSFRRLPTFTDQNISKYDILLLIKKTLLMEYNNEHAGYNRLVTIETQLHIRRKMLGES